MAVILTILLLCTQASGQTTDLKQDIERQIAELKKLNGDWERIIANRHDGSASDESSPVPRMIQTGGMESIPLWIPYLSDTTPTQTIRYQKSQRKFVVRVNEYVLHIINRIAGHDFWQPESLQVIGNRDEPVKGEPVNLDELKTIIQNWWDENHTRTPLERRVADFNDPQFINRFRAYHWLGQRGYEPGRLALEERIQVLERESIESSLVRGELVAAVDSLSHVGNPKSAETILRICERLDAFLLRALNPETPRYISDSDFLSDYFTCYKGLARLTAMDEVVARLSKFREAHHAKMSEEMLTEFDKRLKELPAKPPE